MSRKYFDKLMVGSGSTTKTVKSKFAAKIMEQLGWEAGKGLGKNEDGMKDCIQVKRREEGVGLGQESITPTTQFKWNDSFWTDIYNKNVSKFAQIKPDGVTTEAASDSETDSSTDSSKDSFKIEIIKETKSYFKIKSKSIKK